MGGGGGSEVMKMKERGEPRCLKHAYFLPNV